MAKTSMTSTEADCNYSFITPPEIEARIASIPLPKGLKTRFTAVTKRWLSMSGPEWTVSRLKSFKECLIASYGAGGHLRLKPEWFATTRSGNLAGVWGDLWSLAMENTSRLEAVLFLTNLYTLVSRTKCNTPMLEEIKTSIQQQPIKIPYRKGKNLVGLTDVFKAFRRLGRPPRRLRTCGLPEPITKNPPGKVGHLERLHNDIRDLAGSPLYAAFPQVFDAALGAGVSGIMTSKFSTIVGDIGITHEPGLKTRYFANPNSIIQRALEPLKGMLLTQLDRGLFPWDCTLDQRGADEIIQSALCQGRTVHSVDMSKATDSFPWEFQYRVGQELTIPGSHGRVLLDLMHMCTQCGVWRMPEGFGIPPVRFTKGQPLGLGPSFPLFTISHGILLYILNGCMWSESFFVLGDDVVILDDSLAQKYRKVLVAWGVQVSEAKSYTSSYVAQFAGVTYTRGGRFHVPKWVPFRRDNLLDLAAWWYPGLTKGLKDDGLIAQVLSLPQPYGCGRNPQGLPLSQRFTTKVVDELLKREERHAQAPKEAATSVNLMRLADLLEGHLPNRYPMLALLRTGDQAQLEAPFATGNSSSDITITAPRQRWSYSDEVLALMDGTDIPGFPRIRRKAKRVDPYTLGTLKSWKRLLSRCDTP